MVFTIVRKVSGFCILVGVAFYFSITLTAGSAAMGGEPVPSGLGLLAAYCFLLAAGGAVVYGGAGLLRTFVRWVREQRAARVLDLQFEAERGSVAAGVLLVGVLFLILTACVVSIASVPENSDEIQVCADAMQEFTGEPNGVPLVDRLPECSTLTVEDQATAITWAEPSEG